MGELKDRIMRNAARGGQPKEDVMGTFAMMATTKYLLDYEKVSLAIDETKKHIAARNPVAATRLDAVRDILWQANEGTKTLFDEQGKTEYMATVVFGFDAHEPELARLVLTLAWMHSPITWWRVKRAWKRRLRDNGVWVKSQPEKDAGPLPP
jgi:hypothetical protein